MPKTNEKVRALSLNQMLKKPKPKKPKEGIDNRLKEILEEIGMPQQELADLTNLYPSHISEIISKKRKGVTLVIAIKIAQAVNMSVEDIFFINEEHGN